MVDLFLKMRGRQAVDKVEERKAPECHGKVDPKALTGSEHGWALVGVRHILS